MKAECIDAYDVDIGITHYRYVLSSPHKGYTHIIVRVTFSWGIPYMEILACDKLGKIIPCSFPLYTEQGRMFPESALKKLGYTVE